MITEETVMNNLSEMIRHGMRAQHGDRSVSWLPFYHDMGLVGQVLAPMACQISVDYLSPRDFAMRPRLWLKLISDNQATVSFGPPFGYELCLQRLRANDLNQLDLSTWRVAGVGAEPIRLEPLARFARALAPTGFNKNAFVAGYGMAECSLAVSFSPLGQGLLLDNVDPQRLSKLRKALPVNPLGKNSSRQTKGFINCGSPLPGYEVEVRDSMGQALTDRQIGTLFVRGPSVMSGYFGHPHATRDVLSADGWLNTGDLAYRVGENIYITGREKDMIIINGRNVWPQDLEYLAESQPEVRTGDASAFVVRDQDGKERAVLVIQCRESDEVRRAALIKRVQGLIRRELAIDCFIELVPRHTLPRTTSGKLSRSKARKDFLERMAEPTAERLKLAG
jgi:fatty-acyl-CoA synthase